MDNNTLYEIYKTLELPPTKTYSYKEVRSAFCRCINKYHFDANLDSYNETKAILANEAIGAWEKYNELFMEQTNTILKNITPAKDLIKVWYADAFNSSYNILLELKYNPEDFERFENQKISFGLVLCTYPTEYWASPSIVYTPDCMVEANGCKCKISKPSYPCEGGWCEKTVHPFRSSKPRYNVSKVFNNGNPSEQYVLRVTGTGFYRLGQVGGGCYNTYICFTPDNSQYGCTYTLSLINVFEKGLHQFALEGYLTTNTDSILQFFI